MKMLRMLLTGLALSLAVEVSAKDLLNLGRGNLALQGYDPVAYFTDQKPVKGNPLFSASHQGAVYHFSSAAHREAFAKEPGKYVPAFGGYCAYGVSRNKLVEVDVEAWQIVDGRLLLQYSNGVRNDFNKDPKANLTKADQNWPGLLEKKGR